MVYRRAQRPKLIAMPTHWECDDAHALGMRSALNKLRSAKTTMTKLIMKMLQSLHKNLFLVNSTDPRGKHKGRKTICFYKGRYVRAVCPSFNSMLGNATCCDPALILSITSKERGNLTLVKLRVNSKRQITWLFRFPFQLWRSIGGAVKQEDHVW